MADDLTAARERHYWYFIWTEYCPACNRTTVTRERRYTPRPERWEDRHHDEEVWDGCR